MTLDPAATDLRRRIDDKTAVVGVIGLGYVGLPLLRAFFQAGFPVIGFDIDPAKIDALKAGRNYLKHLGEAFVRELAGSDRFAATADFGRLGEADAVICCVPTPLGPHLEPDLSFVEKSADDIARTLRRGQLIVLESSTYPGTTRDVMLPRFESRGLRCGSDFYLAYSPEREDPGRRDHNTQTIPKLVGGIDPASGELATALYRQAIREVIPVSTAEVAEAAKILENVYRAVNIALVNEMKTVLTAMGIDVWEVIAAAATKPFGFQAFYPGPGLGGHCLGGTETVRVRGPGFDTVMPFKSLFERCLEGQLRRRIGEAEVVEPAHVEALSLDVGTGVAVWKPVSHLSRRPYRGEIVEVRLTGNQALRVTDRHPMLVWEAGRFVTRFAGGLKAGDHVPQFNMTPVAPGAAGGAVDGRRVADPKIDLLAELPADLVDRLHVRIRGTPWATHEKLLKSRFGWTIRDSIRKDSLSARRFLQIESELGMSRSALTLLSGRGSSHTSLPAVLSLTPEFCRFVGYFLSEGCISEERGNARIRLTFNRDEVAYVADVRRLLEELGVRTTVYQDKTWHSSTIRVSSAILGRLMRDVLRTGVNSYTMCVPPAIMGASPCHHVQLLTGLLRGDGDVYVHTGTRPYRKNGRTYEHQFNSGEVGYFSCSPELLAQAETLLQSLGFRTSHDRVKPRLCMFRADDLDRLAPLLGDAKGERLERLGAARVRRLEEPRIDGLSGARLARVDAVSRSPADELVYSMEVAETHTFAATHGVFVHNCIPIDPYYLTWKAREVGLPTKFIELAGEINRSMPDYVVQRTSLALNERGKSVKAARILVLGLAYKPDVDDVRESPSFELIEKLRHLGAEVDYNDPHVPRTHRMRRYDLGMSSVPLTAETLGGYDCVIVSTHHSAYDWQFIADHARLVIDTRGVMRKVTGPRDHIVSA